MVNEDKLRKLTELTEGMSGADVKEAGRIFKNGGLEAVEMWIQARKLREETSTFPVQDLLNSIDFSKYHQGQEEIYDAVLKAAEDALFELYKSGEPHQIGVDLQYAMRLVNHAVDCLSLFSSNHLRELRLQHRLGINASIINGDGIVTARNILAEYESQGSATIDRYSLEQLQRALFAFSELKTYIGVHRAQKK